jgi:hydrogenase maturation protein HypF
MQALVPSGPRTEPHDRRRLDVRGAVQGVGFRPFVYREATRRGLAGWVRNSPTGVTIEVEGPVDHIDDLADLIRNRTPAPARIDTISQERLAPNGKAGFAIAESNTAGPMRAEVLPDIAICGACLAEMLDPADRRFRHPFITCAQCGPRYSIIEALPYDRARTSMRGFEMCRLCQAEYDDPASRRFHAEATACPDCGPRLSLWSLSGAVRAREGDALARTVDAIRDGEIVAVKGIGGFHLLADAGNDEAVARLRSRKGRDEKPFAVMVRDRNAAAECCAISPAADRLLSGPERPIVLLPRHGGAIARTVAPESARLGVMLPYSPLHHLLLHDLGIPVVATSGNLSGEPIITDERDALQRLAGIADLLLVHDRPILRAIDDSVAQVVNDKTQLLRRARGFVPAPIAVEGLAEGLLAHGGHLKSTVAVSTPGAVVLSQHLGDLETASSRDGYQAALADLVRLFDVIPRRAVRDLHPDYWSTRTANGCGLPVTTVQHHVAHAAACLGENGLGPPALAVVWDGTGYGPDGTVWGGEFLLITERGWQRVARLRPFPLPGGEVAVREPRRTALALLHQVLGDACFDRDDLPPVRAFRAEDLRILKAMLTRNVNAPMTSSAGRLFDGIAALCGLHQIVSYEGQAAAALESIAGTEIAEARFTFPLTDPETKPNCLDLDWRPAVAAMMENIESGMANDMISARFHEGLADAIVTIALRVGCPTVALTGGCFQNVRLSEAAARALHVAGFKPVSQRRIPPNDGGIAFGQAIFAFWMERNGDGPCA